MKKASPNFLNEFLQWARYINGSSERTVNAYREDIETFWRWFVETVGEPELDCITSIDLREYQSHLYKTRGLKPGTVNRRMTGLKNYVRWAVREGHMTRQPAFPKAVRHQKAPPRSLSGKEQNRLLRELEKRGKPRDTALVRIFLSCGLRVGEAVSLQLDDLVLGERCGVLTVRRGKGNKWREVPVPVAARKAIRKWLELRNRKHPDSPWLFPNYKGGHISIRRAEAIVSNVARLAALQIHPHVLRHTMARNMLDAGADLVTVAQVLGHDSLDTTAIYTKPNQADIIRAMERAET